MLYNLLTYCKKLGWSHAQIGFFIISFQFTTKSTVIAGLIIWLTLVSVSLGLLKLNQVLNEIY